MRAFIYLRVSTPDQEYSPEAQLQHCRAYCEVRGLEVAATFNETGVSARIPFGERPQGRLMLDRIGEVDAVVFSKLDRAFRDTVDCILTVQELHEAGKVVHFIDLGVDTSTPAGALQMELMAAFAKFERRRISDRTREALAVARTRGVKSGPAPFGYDNVVEFGAGGEKVGRGRHRKNDGEFPIVEQVLAMKAQGMGASKIAEELKAWGIATRLGGSWSGNHISRMLKREQA